MALNRYITTARVTLTPGTFTLDATTGERLGTGSYANAAGNYGSGGPVTIPKGTVLMLDPAGAAFAAIGAGNLAAWSAGQESGGIDGTAN